MLELVVDNSNFMRAATFDRLTRDQLTLAANALRTLAEIQEELRQVDRGDMSLTALGMTVSMHLRGASPWDARVYAEAVNQVADMWDASGVPLRIVVDAGRPASSETIESKS